MKTVLVTGGLGFIGSHTCIDLLLNGYYILIIDNLFNSYKKTLQNIEIIAKENRNFLSEQLPPSGASRLRRVIFLNVDLKDYKDLELKLKEFNQIDLCIHFAGLKFVNESINEPLIYYENNISGTINLLKILEQKKCQKFIFSSTCTVYGEKKKSPLTENMKAGDNITNPYSRSKFMIEEILRDYEKSRNNFSVIVLRYFNPVGAHRSGLVGDLPRGNSTNLFPIIFKVLKNEIDQLTIFGNDYPTIDGTPIRDFIHIEDLSRAHICAVKKLDKISNGFFIYNLGNGKGYSVLQVLKEIERISGEKIKFEFGPRRDGDIDIIFCDPKKALNELQWHSTKTLSEMCIDSYNFYKNNL